MFLLEERKLGINEWQPQLNATKQINDIHRVLYFAEAASQDILKADPTAFFSLFIFNCSFFIF